MVRVLHVINGWAMGGITQATLDLIKNTPKIKHYSIGYCWLDTPIREDFERAGCESIASSDEEYSCLYNVLTSKEISIVHKQTGGGDFPEWVQACKELGFPVVETIHCPRKSGIPPDHVAATHITTNYVANMNRDRPVWKIPYPCTLPLGHKRISPRHRDEKIVIGRLARYEPTKLPDVIVNVAHLLYEYKDDIEFKIMGFPFNEDCYNQMIQHRIPGYLSIEGLQNDKLAALNTLDICIDPVQETSFDMVMTEAMSQGIPVVTWQDSAAPEVCGEAGIITTRKVFELARGCLSLVYDLDKYRKCSQAAIDQVKLRHNPEDYGKKFEALYRRVFND
jgi:glycosyltransferase involved in cell wall biosynthesis